MPSRLGYRSAAKHRSTTTMAKLLILHFNPIFLDLRGEPCRMIIEGYFRRESHAPDPHGISVRRRSFGGNRTVSDHILQGRPAGSPKELPGLPSSRRIGAHVVPQLRSDASMG